MGKSKRSYYNSGYHNNAGRTVYGTRYNPRKKPMQFLNNGKVNLIFPIAVVIVLILLIYLGIHFG